MKNYIIVLRGLGLPQQELKSTNTLKGARRIAAKIDAGIGYIVIVCKTGAEYYL